MLTAPFVAAISLAALLKPEKLISVITTLTTFFYNTFDWLVVWLPLLAMATGIYFALSKYGKIRFGGPDAQPEYTLFSWMAMLFTAGIGVGIVFYGPIEGLWHYFNSPIGVSAGLSPAESMENAMALSLWVWGIPAWALYTLGGLIVAYFAYQHNMDFSPSAVIEKAYSKRQWAKPLSVTILAIAIISIALSVSSSIAMATTQIASGLKMITGHEYTGAASKITILFCIFAAYTAAAVLPIKKGMKALGDWTMYVSIALLIFVFLVGPTHYFISVIMNTLGRIITQTIPFSFEMYLFRDRSWFTWYPMAYWVWWITWTPFVGVFLAKISKGRTIKQFILSSIFVPSGFMLVWFSSFSGYSLLDTIEGSGKIAEIANSGSYEGTIYHMLSMLPLSKVTIPVTVCLFIGFVVTTVTSAAISLGIMTSADGKSESKSKAVLWCVFMALIGFAVIITGKIEGIKSVGSFAGFGFVFILLILIAGFIKQIRKDMAKKLPGAEG
jgi:choline-glycine betaine transporter